MIRKGIYYLILTMIYSGVLFTEDHQRVLVVSPFRTFDFLVKINKSPENSLPIFSQSWLKAKELLADKNIYLDFAGPIEIIRRYDELIDRYDLFFFHDFLEKYKKYHLEKLFPKSILLLFESFAIYNSEYDRELVNKFPRVLSWKDDWIDHKKISKFHYPVLKPLDESNVPFRDKQFACMLVTNKLNSYPGELFSERLKIIKYFDENSCGFDLFGKNWNNRGGWYKDIVGCYRGISKDKHSLLKKYKFNFCLENCSHVGYITEKLFDAFSAGCIPIYKGPSNIGEYIPKECYINYDDFESLSELEEYLNKYTEKMYLEHLRHVRNFVESPESKKFSGENFVELVVKEILNYFNVNREIKFQ